MTEGERSFLKAVEAFARDDVAPHTSGWAQGEAPDASIYKKAARIGVTRVEVPVDQGGLGLDFAAKARAAEILAAADFGFAMSVVNTANIALRISAQSDDAFREQYLSGLLDGTVAACTALTEPSVGSDVAALTTTAKQADDGWELTGEKCWIVNGRHAGLAIVYAQCGEQGDGKGIGAFLVDLTARGCTRYAMISEFPQESMGTGGFRLDQCQVSDQQMLAPPGEAFRAIMAEINGARTYLAAMCCGMLDAAISCVRDYGKRRQTFGQPLAHHQKWRLRLAEAATELAAAKALTARAVDAVAEKGDAQLLAAQAKVFAVAACQRWLPILMQAMGAEGLKPDYPLARHLAATQSAALTDGTTDMLLERVARLIQEKGE